MDDIKRTTKARASTALETAALVTLPAAGFLIPTDWRWSAGALLTAGSLFVLGFFGLADQ